MLILTLLLSSRSSFAQNLTPPTPDQDPQFEPGQKVEVEAPKIALSDGHFIIRSGLSTYTFKIIPEDPELQKNLDSMSESDLFAFQKKRQNLLTISAASLNAIKYSYGIGALTKDGLVFLKEKIRPSPKDQSKEAARVKGLSARSTQVTQALLSSIDRQLLTQAPLVARANEYGMTLNMGFAALAGTNQKPFGGLFDLGFSLTYNEDTRTLVFQLYRNVEAFKNTSTGFTSYIGLATKAGILLYNRAPGTELSSLKGSTFYPPAVPGYLTRSTSMISSGFSSGLGFPPPPLGDLLTYTNSIDHRTIVRISVSPLIKGFIRIGFGVHRQDFIWIPETMDRMHDFILRSWRKAGLCKMVYVH
jgi:hypothetical protein